MQRRDPFSSTTTIDNETLDDWLCNAPLDVQHSIYIDESNVASQTKPRHCCKPRKCRVNGGAVQTIPTAGHDYSSVPCDSKASQTMATIGNPDDHMYVFTEPE